MGAKRNWFFGLAVIVPVVAGVVIGLFQHATSSLEEPPSRPSLPRSSGPLAPLPPSLGLLRPGDRELVPLGRALFHDGRLSRDGSISCASCHPIANAGVDGLPTSLGVEGRTGQANAPSVLNAALNFRQFWDGRARTLEEQVAGPIHNPVEMDSNWRDVLSRLAGDEEYRRLLRQSGSDPLSAELIARAIAAYERTLLTPDSPFDRFLRGDSRALSVQQQRGYELFQGLGCVSCHQGVNLGGNLFAHLGVMGDFFADRPTKKIDLGRYNVTGQESDKHKFKVPSLRNVALTAPYFHDGSVETLEKAVEIMARFQLGVELGANERDALVVFLHSLTGLPPTE